MVQYPIAEKIPDDVLEAEVKKLELLKSKSFFLRFWGYLRLGGPGFMDSAITLVAGTFIQGFPGGGEKTRVSGTF